MQQITVILLKTANNHFCPSVYLVSLVQLEVEKDPPNPVKPQHQRKHSARSIRRTSWTPSPTTLRPFDNPERIYLEAHLNPIISGFCSETFCSEMNPKKKLSGIKLNYRFPKLNILNLSSWIRCCCFFFGAFPSDINHPIFFRSPIARTTVLIQIRGVEEGFQVAFSRPGWI